MKNLFATVCVLGSLVAVAACSTERPTGNVDAAPYTESRTAGSGTTIEADVRTEVAPARDVRAERVYREKQTK